MNPLAALENVLSSATPAKSPARYHGPNGTCEAIQPTVTVPGAKTWIPQLIDYAKTGEVKVGGLGCEVVELALIGGELVITLQADDYKFKAFRRLRTRTQKQLAAGEWATINGWQFRLLGGLKVPMFTVIEANNSVAMHMRFDVRKKGFFGMFLNATIDGLAFGNEGGELAIRGLKRFFVSPRLVWGD